ncbi:MAG TPA: hypothetical protein VGW98_02075, partial [Solirubrobacteraceae bacterium]|nr:hypothetical protein [Solirubrobacteraceae bacterium]
MDLRRLGVGNVERGKELADGGLVAERGLVDAAGSRFVALGLGVELLALRLELLHLGGGVGGATFEVGLRLPRCAQVTPQFLNLRLAVEREHRETGVLLLSPAFLGDRVFERVDALQPVTRILQAGREQGRLERLHDPQLGLRQRRNGLSLLRQFVDRGSCLASGGKLSLKLGQASLEVVQRTSAPARLADPMGPLLAEAVEHFLRRSVGMRRVGQGDDRLLDRAGVFKAQHLAARDA